jgi:spermidine/putrescine transport system ATP-binding protein
VTVAIRPERLGLWHADADRDLGSTRPPAGSTASRSSATRSPTTCVTERGDPPQSFRVRQGNTPGIEHFAVGERVRVRWAPTSATVLED